MNETTVRRAVRLYGYDAALVMPSAKGYRNESHPVRLQSGQQANLILYKNEPGIADTIRRTNQISAYLAQKGLSVRRPLDHRLLRLSDNRQTRYAALYVYLPGETIPWEAYTQQHLKLLGQAMAAMHTALAGYADASLPHVAQQYNLIVKRMRRYLADPAVCDALTQKLGVSIEVEQLKFFEQLLHACKRLPGQQALHMDFVRSNILFAQANGLRITGLLDFEKAAYGHPLFDVARTTAFLLVDCKYKSDEKVRKYFLQSGYHKRGMRVLPRYRVAAPHGKEQLFEQLLNLFLLHDFYKFLRHNPYEALSANEHYLRTRDLLLSRKVITTTTSAQ